MESDLISRQDAIDEIEYELEMINSALDSITLDFNARERLRQRRGEAREILNSIQQLPSVQPETFKEKLNEIASALSEKFAYMNTCLNERDIILGYLGVKRPCKTHCNTDCTNTKCESHPSSAQLKTGKWIPCDVDIRGMTNMFVCSKCGSFTSLPILKYANAMEYDFCPNCGAYMRGEKDE